MRIRSWRPAMPSISGPRSTVESSFTVTPFVSGATSSLLMVLSCLHSVGLPDGPPSAKAAISLLPETLWHRIATGAMMNPDLEHFLTHYARVVVMSLVPVVIVAFLSMPMCLGFHPGHPDARAQSVERHMT